MTSNIKHKSTYIAPQAITFDVQTEDLLVASYAKPKLEVYDLPEEKNFCASTVYSIDFDKKQTICPETRCPFNFKWCRDKQRALDEWRAAIEHYAQKGVSDVIHTSADMFDGCPHNYGALCSLHEQRQR